MSGTHDQRDERMRRRVEHELRARPPLPVWQKRVLERCAVARANGWFTLLNQFAPHTPPQRPDLVLIGPRGVLVVLLREQLPNPEAARAAFVWTAELLAGVSTPRGLLTEAALRTVVVRPLGARGEADSAGEYLVLGERDADELFCGDAALSAADVLATATHLEHQTFDLTPIAWNPDRIPRQRPAGQTGPAPGPSGLFEVEDLREHRLNQATERPFRDWRIFLDDGQLGIVRREYNGPARITGPAGTGKTVLALHRLAYLARRTHGPLLFTTHVADLPKAARRQFTALAPQLGHRVEFTHLHAWARNLLAERGRSADVDSEEVEAAFQAVWSRAGGRLERIRASWSYWRDEIDRVIKGRGIGTLAGYRQVSRRGRGTHLPARARALVWEFYCEYERELSERGVYDYNDVLIRALAELNRDPLPDQYTAVVVDEVQDLTLVGLRLVHAISGDRPNQLLLVGDGEQQVYAGGWRLSEAGIAIHGRGEVLRRNYRNRETVLTAAAELETINRFDDLDNGPAAGLRSALPVLGGGQVVRWRGADQPSALLEALRTFDDLSDVAVLTATNRSAEAWSARLRAAGFAVTPLNGERPGAVRVGTLFRAKGIEFRAVLVPDDPPAGTPQREEREALLRRELVARTRARDYLWIGELAH